MLSENVNWNELKSGVTYRQSDSLAVIRTDSNALSYLPVFINAASGEPHIRQENEWHLAEHLPCNSRGFPRFERYQKLGRKKLLDTSTLELVEV